MHKQPVHHMRDNGAVVGPAVGLPINGCAKLAELVAAKQRSKEGCAAEVGTSFNARWDHAQAVPLARAEIALKRCAALELRRMKLAPTYTLQAHE
eukprot:6212399-Pleurochrysis_carterae.AAC.1